MELCHCNYSSFILDTCRSWTLTILPTDFTASYPAQLQDDYPNRSLTEYGSRRIRHNWCPKATSKAQAKITCSLSNKIPNQSHCTRHDDPERLPRFCEGSSRESCTSPPFATHYLPLSRKVHLASTRPTSSRRRRHYHVRYECYHYYLHHIHTLSATHMTI